jgi:hypothetical protein
LIRGRFALLPWVIKVCRQRVDSLERTFVAPWPLDDGPRATFVTMPYHGVVMMWRDIPRQRPFYPSLLPVLSDLGVAMLQGALQGVIFHLLQPYSQFTLPVVSSSRWRWVSFLFSRFACVCNACTHGMCFLNFSFLPRSHAEPPSHLFRLRGFISEARPFVRR